MIRLKFGTSCFVRSRCSLAQRLQLIRVGLHGSPSYTYYHLVEVAFLSDLLHAGKLSAFSCSLRCGKNSFSDNLEQNVPVLNNWNTAFSYELIDSGRLCVVS